jgi:hypothetical protein
MAGSPSSGSGGRFRERTPIFYRFLYKNRSTGAKRPWGGSRSRRKGPERERGRTTADGTAGMRSVSAVTRSQALKLILRRRFQGTVTKSTRRAGWMGLCFPVMAELQKMVLGCSAFHESSIGFVGAQRTITRGRFCPYPDG